MRLPMGERSPTWVCRRFGCRRFVGGLAKSMGLKGLSMGDYRYKRSFNSIQA